MEGLWQLCIQYTVFVMPICEQGTHAMDMIDLCKKSSLWLHIKLYSIFSPLFHYLWRTCIKHAISKPATKRLPSNTYILLDAQLLWSVRTYGVLYGQQLCWRKQCNMCQYQIYGYSSVYCIANGIQDPRFYIGVRTASAWKCTWGCALPLNVWAGVSRTLKHGHQCHNPSTPKKGLRSPNFFSTLLLLFVSI